jgi:hypothetical protein
MTQLCVRSVESQDAVLATEHALLLLLRMEPFNVRIATEPVGSHKCRSYPLHEVDACDSSCVYTGEASVASSDIRF